MQNTLYIPIETTIDNPFECEKLVKRGDTVVLNIKVFSNSALVNLTGQSIDLILKKSDGTLIQKEIDATNISNGTVTAKLDIQATVIAGEVSGELQLTDSNGQNSTNTFTFNVSTSIADNVIEVSRNDINILNELRQLIANGEAIIAQYEDNILAIANTIEAIEALANIKSYIDTNLAALESNNAQAVVNINNLKTENDKAPGLTSNLKAQNDAATSNISTLTTKNQEAVTNKNNIDSSISAANASKIALDTSKNNADNTKNALDDLKTDADNTKNALNTVNQTGQTLLNSLETFEEQHADVTDISNKLAGINEGLSEMENNKVDKVTGKGLSTNDYDNTEKAEVSKVKNKADTTYVDTKIASVVNGSPKGVYSTLSALQTAYPTGNANIYLVIADGKWYYWNGSTWLAGGVYQSTGIADKSIKEHMLSSTYVYGIKGKNLFNKNDITYGYYVSMSTGNLGQLANCNASYFIKIESGKYYNLSGTAQQFALYDANYNYIIGYDQAWKLTSAVIPSNVSYIRFTMLTGEENSVQLEEGQTQTSYEEYKQVLDNSNISQSNIDYLANKILKPNRIISVKKDGTSDYSSVYDAVISSLNIPTDIQIHEGEYDIISELPASMVSSPQAGASLGLRGLEIPDNVNLIGIGSRNKIILKGELPDTATATQITILSTLNVAKSSKLENLTVTAKNLRYAVHNESSNTYKDWTLNVKNCKFIHYGNVVGTWDWCSTWGEGCSSGSTSVFEDCDFINYTVNPTFGVHNNTGFTLPSSHKFKNCNFTNLISGGVAFRCGSMGSGQTDSLDFVGCNFTGLVITKEELNNGCGLDFSITGYANSYLEYSIINSDNKQYSYNLKGETIELVNKETFTLSKGFPVKKNGITVEKMKTGDNPKLFFGIAFTNIASGKSGIVKYGGYIKLTDIGLTGNIGDNVTINAGNFAVTTDSNCIGVIVSSDYLKLL